MVPIGSPPFRSRMCRQRWTGRWGLVPPPAVGPVHAEEKNRMPLLAPISVGELLDKITILEIKAEAITAPEKRTNVLRELTALAELSRREVAASPELDSLRSELRAVNRRLWEVEEAIRLHEGDGRF